MKIISNKLRVLSSELIKKIKLFANNGLTFTQGDVLFNEGDCNEFVYLIDKGVVALVKNKNANKVEFLSQNDGDIVGIDLIFNDKNCEYSAIVSEKSVLNKVLISDLREYIANNTDTSLEILKYLSSLINKLEHKKLA